MIKKIYTQDEINDIIYLYIQKQTTLKAIGEKYNVSRNVIKRVLQENDINVRKTTNCYKANYNIFENIDTPLKAYWLGFLAADGCNYQRIRNGKFENATIFINIHQKDRNQLVAFQDFLGTNAKIIDYITNAGFSNNTPMCKMSVNSIKMSIDLADKGIIPKKSLILKPPNIDEEFYLPYILGYFDGDGSITKAFHFRVEGTKETLEWMNKVLGLSCKLEKRYNDEKNNYYIRVYKQQDVYNVLTKLYNSCEYHLERKYLIYKQLEQVVLNRNVK